MTNPFLVSHILIDKPGLSILGHVSRGAARLNDQEREKQV